MPPVEDRIDNIRSQEGQEKDAADVAVRHVRPVGNGPYRYSFAGEQLATPVMGSGDGLDQGGIGSFTVVLGRAVGYHDPRLTPAAFDPDLGAKTERLGPRRFAGMWQRLPGKRLECADDTIRRSFKHYPVVVQNGFDEDLAEQRAFSAGFRCLPSFGDTACDIGQRSRCWRSAWLT